MRDFGGAQARGHGSGGAAPSPLAPGGCAVLAMRGMKETARRMWTIPNILTVARLVAAPCVALAFTAFERPLADALACALFVAAALTDWLDGKLARAWGQVSAVGRLLDPIADKAIVLIALATLTGLHGLHWLLLAPVALIILRETAVAGLREYLAGAAALPVTALAKWKTTAQLAAISVLLGAGAAGAAAEGLHALGLALLWVAAALTAITGWDYFQRGLAFVRQGEG